MQRSRSKELSTLRGRKGSLRSDIQAGAVSPDHELSDQCGKHCPLFEVKGLPQLNCEVRSAAALS